MMSGPQQTVANGSAISRRVRLPGRRALITIPRVFDGKLWVLGGHGGVADRVAEVATDGNRNDVWFSENGENWQELPQTPWSLRHACGVHVHRDALFLAAGSAVSISPEQAELSKRDFTHRVESTWRPGDVWRLERATC